MYDLIVDGREFAESMQLLNRTSKQSAASELALYFENGELTAELAGACVSVPATGTWPGTVTVHRGVIEALSQVTSGQTALTITDDERFKCGGISFSCRVSPLPDASIDLPLDPKLIQLLRLRQDYSDEELLASGLLERVEKAEREMESLIAAAATTLKDLGDFRVGIRRLVRVHVYGEE